MAADDTPIHDELVMEQYAREVAEYVAQFEAEDTDAYCNEVDATAPRGGNPLVTAAALAAAVLAPLLVIIWAVTS